MQLIAERELIFIRDGRKRGRRTALRIYAPECRDAAAWNVTYVVEGPGKHRLERYVIGIDAVQALQWALQVMPMELKSFAQELGGRFTFLDGNDMGFTPLSLPST